MYSLFLQVQKVSMIIFVPCLQSYKYVDRYTKRHINRHTEHGDKGIDGWTDKLFTDKYVAHTLNLPKNIWNKLEISNIPPKKIINKQFSK